MIQKNSIGKFDSKEKNQEKNPRLYVSRKTFRMENIVFSCMDHDSRG